MSGRFAKIPEQFIRDPRITLRDHKVYSALRLYADRDGGQCFPPREKIAEICGLMRKDQDGRTVPHVARVSEITNHLERLGWIKKVGKGGRLRGDKGRHTCFTLLDAPESTLPNSGSLTESTTLDSGTSTVPDSGTVTKSTVPDSGTSTVPDLGTQNRGFSQSTSGFPATHQTIDQTIKEITDHEGGAIAPVAASAAPPPPVFSHDQNQHQNPETEGRQQPEATVETVSAATPSKTKATKAKAKTKHGTRMTLEELPDDWREWAEGFIEHHAIGNLLDIGQMWLLFRGHYKTTTKNAVQLDWEETWKNWWRREMKTISQRPSTRKILEENRTARDRREARQRQLANEQAEREQREAEEAAKKAASEQRRIELAPVAARVKAHLQDIPHGLSGFDLANSLDMTEDALEEVYRSHLCRDPEIVCCSLKLQPNGEWISAAAHEAREAAKKAQPKAQIIPTPATTSSNWYDDEPEAPAPAAPPPAAAQPAPAAATRCTPAELDATYATIAEAGPRGINIADIPNLTHRVLRALLDAGRMRLDGATVTATKYGSRLDEPVPLGAVLHRFNTSTSTTSTVSLTGRAVL